MANVSLKLQALDTILPKLNPVRRQHWARVIAALKERANQRARAVGDEARTTEWDLALANELDRIYTAVSDEASRVRREGTAALADTTAAIGYGTWPLAIAVVAVLYFWGRK